MAIDQTKYVRYADEYDRFSKAAGLPTQQERLYQNGFGPKQAKAAKLTADDVFKNQPKDLKELSAKVDETLGQYCERDSKWSGRTIVLTD